MRLVPLHFCQTHGLKMETTVRFQHIRFHYPLLELPQLKTALPPGYVLSQQKY